MIVTLVAARIVPVNATTVGFAYLLLVLIIAAAWGFLEALLASVLATLCFNFFFLPPVGTLTISDPQNWVALFSFLATSLIASRLSAVAKRRRQDVERLYAFSRALLLSDGAGPFPARLVGKLAEIFQLTAAALYERDTDELYCAGANGFEDLREQLRDAAVHGTAFSDSDGQRTIVAIRLGAEPVAGLAIQGQAMPKSLVQGIGNLVAIGLERARAQDLAQQVEAARQSEQLRTTLIDAMAHEFKTPLTLIKATTTALLANPDEPLESRTEQLTMADEEADHLRELIDDAIEMARLDTARIEVHLEMSDPRAIVREVSAAMQSKIDERPFQVCCDHSLPAIPLDRRLIKIAIRQLLDNALKYSPSDTPVTIRIEEGNAGVTIAITDHGNGIPAAEQTHIFDRFYRSPSVKQQIPGSGLGLSIAHSIVRAHRGDLTVTSRPGETTFRMTLPNERTGDNN
jgi:two-component system sensor histidine kinase KdpD